MSRALASKPDGALPTTICCIHHCHSVRDAASWQDTQVSIAVSSGSCCIAAVLQTLTRRPVPCPWQLAGQCSPTARQQLPSDQTTSFAFHQADQWRAAAPCQHKGLPASCLWQKGQRGDAGPACRVLSAAQNVVRDQLTSVSCAEEMQGVDPTVSLVKFPPPLASLSHSHVMQHYTDKCQAQLPT